jgi:sirohydrochlorin ferrochelatase
VATFGDRFCITSSMGDAVLAHLASKVAPGIDVVFLGHRLPLRRDDRHPRRRRGHPPGQPADDHAGAVVAEQDATYGKDLYKTDPDLCCNLRKVQPLATSLAGYDAWATGLRRAETHNRVIAPVVGWDARKGKVKSPRSRGGATTTSSATSPRTTCWSTRWSTTATRRSAALRARGGSPPATTRAAAAGQVPTRPSAASTDEALPDPSRHRRRDFHPHHVENREEATLMAAPALVALAHGSRDPRSSASITALVDAVRSMRPDLKVERAFLDLSKPSLDTVIDRLSRKHEEIVVVPLLLTEAYHAKVDVPSAIAAAQARHPEVRIRRHPDPRPRGALPRGARPPDARGARVGPRPRARRARAGRRRVQRPAGQPVGRPAGPAVGSHHKLPVTAAFASTSPPATGEAVRAFRKEGRRHIAVASLFLAPASCRTGPPSSPSRPAPSRSPSRSVPTPRSRATVLARYAVGAVELVPV